MHGHVGRRHVLGPLAPHLAHHLFFNVAYQISSHAMPSHVRLGCCVCTFPRLRPRSCGTSHGTLWPPFIFSTSRCVDSNAMREIERWQPFALNPGCVTSPGHSLLAAPLMVESKLQSQSGRVGKPSLTPVSHPYTSSHLVAAHVTPSHTGAAPDRAYQPGREEEAGRVSWFQALLAAGELKCSEALSRRYGFFIASCWPDDRCGRCAPLRII